MIAVIRSAFIAFVAFVVASSVHAETWPARPVRFIVSQAAGGTPDIITRLIAERVSRSLGQQVVVENRPGGGNVIGAQAAARSAPDGYTFFLATAAALVTNPYTFKSLPYDPQHDFVPVAMVANNPFFLLVNPSVPAKTLPELIAYDKAHPGKLTAATDGPRNFSGMLMAWINKLAGTNLVPVPYAAMPQGIQDALAGRVQVIILAVASAAPHLERGALRAIATSGTTRVPRFETVQPIADTFPGFDFLGWFVLVAPAGTPKDVIERMNKEMNTALTDPAIVGRLQELGFYTQGAGTPASTGAYIRNQLDVWGKVVREIGLKPE
ncbi:MAG TPA: tripartite tricarboxylate transporter substrate-binding protein [Xanthobacteraceae bacterium]|jgi:tripartite-type tricarboxylate transporter receptor subunit TctC|nr:tripartite tricarboxylate transporter substrate-binding protein [Xanthobacteraceae bacterium]